jgi:hypothetical protein
MPATEAHMAGCSVLVRFYGDGGGAARDLGAMPARPSCAAPRSVSAGVVVDAGPCGPGVVLRVGRDPHRGDRGSPRLPGVTGGPRTSGEGQPTAKVGVGEVALPARTAWGGRDVDVYSDCC